MCSIAYCTYVQTQCSTVTEGVEGAGLDDVWLKTKQFFHSALNFIFASPRAKFSCPWVIGPWFSPVLQLVCLITVLLWSTGCTEAFQGSYKSKHWRCSRPWNEATYFSSPGLDVFMFRAGPLRLEGCFRVIIKRENHGDDWNIELHNLR